MGLIGTLLNVVNKSNKLNVETNRQYVTEDFGMDHIDGRYTTIKRGPWKNKYSEVFISRYLETGKAACSFIEAIANLEEIIRHGNDSKSRIKSLISNDLTMNKYISVSCLDPADIKEKYYSISESSKGELYSNMRRTFPVAVGLMPEILSIYILCVVIDTIEGVLPDLYNEKMYEVYTVEKARRILNEFPIRASEANSAELRSANIMIAAYCFALINNVDVYYVVNEICKLTQYKEFKRLGIKEAFRIAKVDYRGLNEDSIKTYSKQNKEFSNMLNMIRYNNIKINEKDTFETRVLHQFEVDNYDSSTTEYIYTLSGKELKVEGCHKELED